MLIKNAKLYDEATRNSEVVAELKKGEEVELLEIENNTWWYVSTAEEEGYIQAKCLEESND